MNPKIVKFGQIFFWSRAASPGKSSEDFRDDLIGGRPQKILRASFTLKIFMVSLGSFFTLAKIQVKCLLVNP
jgi:hypothetical protein